MIPVVQSHSVLGGGLLPRWNANLFMNKSHPLFSLNWTLFSFTSLLQRCVFLFDNLLRVVSPVRPAPHRAGTRPLLIAAHLSYTNAWRVFSAQQMFVA